MDGDEFEATVRRMLAAGGAPSSAALEGMLQDLDYYLSTSGVIEAKSVRVKKKGLPESQLAASCIAAPGVMPDAVVSEIARIWKMHLRYEHAEVHRFRQENGEVIVDLATQAEPNDYAVTATVRVALP